MRHSFSGVPNTRCFSGIASFSTVDVRSSVEMTTASSEDIRAHVELFSGLFCSPLHRENGDLYCELIKWEYGSRD